MTKDLHRKMRKVLIERKDKIFPKEGVDAK